MNDTTLDTCGEFPAANAALGVGTGIEVARGLLFIVPMYRLVLVDIDRRVARRMVSLCRFHQRAA